MPVTGTLIVLQESQDGKDVISTLTWFSSFKKKKKKNKKEKEKEGEGKGEIDFI